MKFACALLGLLVTLTPAAAQGPDYDQLAEASFRDHDYDAARRNLELALSRGVPVARQVDLKRKLAAAHIFQGELTDARKLYEEIIDDRAVARLPADAHDYYALALIGALQHKKHDVLKYLLAGDSAPARAPHPPLVSAIAWAHVGEVDRVARAKAEMEGLAASNPQDTMAQQAAILARLIYATRIRAIDVARAELASLSADALRAYGYAFLANAIRREGKRSEAGAIDQEVRKYRELNVYSAVAWRLIK